MFHHAAFQALKEEHGRTRQRRHGQSTGADECQALRPSPPRQLRRIAGDAGSPRRSCLPRAGDSQQFRSGVRHSPEIPVHSGAARAIRQVWRGPSPVWYGFEVPPQATTEKAKAPWPSSHWPVRALPNDGSSFAVQCQNFRRLSHVRRFAQASQPRRLGWPHRRRLDRRYQSPRRARVRPLVQPVCRPMAPDVQMSERECVARRPTRLCRCVRVGWASSASFCRDVLCVPLRSPPSIGRW
jgi:hypothetical protein